MGKGQQQRIERSKSKWKMKENGKTEGEANGKRATAENRKK